MRWPGTTAAAGGETNRLLRAYHLGDTDDLAAVISHASKEEQYPEIYLTGFSAGGNVTLKYLGEDPARVPPQVRRAAVFSVPTDLKASSVHISRWQNRVYLQALYVLFAPKDAGQGGALARPT
ncbi:MAG: alpha/beta hydrolase [Hymenobacter sp.]